MSAIVGSGDFRYEALDQWPTLPEGANLTETPGVAVDSQDEIYAFSRNTENPVMVFDRDGNYLRGFGKGIFGDQSTGVFNGKIIVDKIAQKTNAFQQNNNLLISDKASVNTKPQLEIFADDVKCSHGCTIGQLDQDALFYLRSRGIGKKEAEALLMYAFANNVLESVRIPELKGRINRLIAEKLGVHLGFDL